MMRGLHQAIIRTASFGARFRSSAATGAFEEAIASQPANSICLSVGGGPTIVHQNLLNLNILIGPNIHLCGDAHMLPVSDSTVDAVYSEAVLEHLERPTEAVAEMYRVLKPGGRLLTVVPFLQVFHGYPSHYQNFTLSGHRELIRAAGFEILDFGTCVGPAFALLDVTSNFFREYIPGRTLSRIAYYMLRICAGPLCVVDKLILRSPSSHILASTTFVAARKSAILSPERFDIK